MMRFLPSLTIMMAFSAAACGTSPAKETPMTTQNQHQAASAIVQRIGLKLPATARIEVAEQIEGQDDAVRVVAVLPDKEWQAVLASLPMRDPQQPPFSPDANFHLGPDDGQWTPSKAEGLSTVQIPWKGGAESLNLGVAPAGAGQTRLFVFWHQL